VNVDMCVCVYIMQYNALIDLQTLMHRCQQLSEMKQVRLINAVCGVCRTTLQFPENYSRAQCPRCRSILQLPRRHVLQDQWDAQNARRAQAEAQVRLANQNQNQNQAASLFVDMQQMNQDHNELQRQEQQLRYFAQQKEVRDRKKEEEELARALAESILMSSSAVVRI
jgi:uncharacterized CHY-type Zn-finger protein